MAATEAGFRAAFPAFQDALRFPAPAVDYRLSLAMRTMNAARWGDLLEHGAYLQTAHYLAIAAEDARAAKFGGKAPGMQTGMLTSKSISKVSASYAHDRSTIEGAGHWNRTSFGVEFYQLMMQIGMGPLQVGVDDPGPGLAGAYSGPPVWP